MPVAVLAALAALVGLVAGACSSSSKPPPNASAPLPTTTTATATATGPTPASATGTVNGRCTPARPQPAGLAALAYPYHGVVRTYEVYVPRSYDGATAVPVVFDFHGSGSNGIQQVIYSNFQPLAEAHDFLIVAPDGQGTGSGRHFNMTGEPGLQNDVVFVGSLLDHIEATMCVDASRVYATGISDGGAMTSVLACQDANRFAAFGPVAVVLYITGCGGTHPVAIMSFNGTADPLVPFTSAFHCCGAVVLAPPSTAMAGWAHAEGCAATPTERQLGTQVTLRSWSGCRAGAAVEYYIIDGGGHTWPGSPIKLPRFGLTTDQVSATGTLWAFFSQHSLASG
jgi:polyhydroxybutyrate depolymerase